MYKKIFSQERLNAYKICSTDTDEDIIAKYLWNIALSETFYPAIAIFEVNYRNHIYNAISFHIMKEWLDEINNPWLLQPEKDQIITAKKKIIKSGKIVTQGQIISQLTLGFWISILKKQYKKNVWNKPRVFEDVFPNFNIKCADRISVVDPHLKKILSIRNRISHHEPILYHPNGLNQVYDDIILAMSWLSKDTKVLMDKLNRFNQVYNRGYKTYKIYPDKMTVNIKLREFIQRLLFIAK